VHPRGDAARVVALVGEESARNRDLAARGSIPLIAPTSAELLGTVDALVVTNRDGALHRAEAEPFLRAGIPVWVDKPLACSTADARALVDAAAAGGAPLTSYSPVRWVDDTTRLVARLPEVGALQTVTVTGPADPASEYGGIFFYGIHCADVAERLVGAEVAEVEVTRVADTVVARYRSGDVLVTLQLVLPDGDRQVPFHATVVGRHGILDTDLRLGDGYVAPGVDTFLAMLETGRPPLPSEALLRPIAVLEQVRAALPLAG
jgi:predicted dehydrogenase